MCFTGLHDSGLLIKGEQICLGRNSTSRGISRWEEDPPGGRPTRGGAYCTGSFPS